MFGSSIVTEMLAATSAPRFKLLLWDYALDADNDPPRTFNVAFNAGVNAIHCYRQYAGIPDTDPLEWIGDENAGVITCLGFEVACCAFIPIKVEIATC